MEYQKRVEDIRNLFNRFIGTAEHLIKDTDKNINLTNRMLKPGNIDFKRALESHLLSLHKDFHNFKKAVEGVLGALEGMFPIDDKEIIGALENTGRLVKEAQGIIDFRLLGKSPLEWEAIEGEGARDILKSKYERLKTILTEEIFKIKDIENHLFAFLELAVEELRKNKEELKHPLRLPREERLFEGISFKEDITVFASEEFYEQINEIVGDGNVLGRFNYAIRKIINFWEYNQITDKPSAHEPHCYGGSHFLNSVVMGQDERLVFYFDPNNLSSRLVLCRYITSAEHNQALNGAENRYWMVFHRRLTRLNFPPFMRIYPPALAA